MPTRTLRYCFFLWSLFFAIGCVPPKKSDHTLRITDKNMIFYPRFFVENDAQKKILTESFFEKIQNGTLKMYKDDVLSQPLTYAQFLQTYNRTDSLLVNDSSPEGFHYQVTRSFFDPKNVVAYKLMAEMGKNAAMQPLSIAPMVDLISDSTIIGQTPIFWVNYKDLD